MALQLILGNAGAGKSHYIFEKIIQESMEHPTKQYLIIVPEQFTMQTQKDLVMMHPRHGIMNIDVLSFERLAHRVFSEVGGEHRKILEDTGKSLVLRKLAEEKKDELTLLGGSLRKLGYISEVKSLLSEFVQYRIEPEDLTQIMEQNKSNPQLYFKLKDMKVIYESFRQYLKDTYLTAEELLKALEDTVEQSRSVRNSVIVLDGYHGFTPIQLGLIGRLLTLTDELYVTMTLDHREEPFQMEAEHQLFYFPLILLVVVFYSCFRIVKRRRTIAVGFLQSLDVAVQHGQELYWVQFLALEFDFYMQQFAAQSHRLSGFHPLSELGEYIRQMTVCHLVPAVTDRLANAMYRVVAHT